MSTYLALTFGTLLSSQGTDASFAATSVAPPGASFFRVPSLSDPSSCSSRLAFVFCDLTARPTFQTLADHRSEKRIRPQSRKTHTAIRTDTRQGAIRCGSEVVFQGIGRSGTVRADACPVLPAERLENSTPRSRLMQTVPGHRCGRLPAPGFRAGSPRPNP
ncbi:hypothetical protein E6W39_14835 [Kitasatospora acidiphila]|uniref:Uncharacterized protein n=1 Tax=Kitasatospora acidiphila TaxID=2567942 RepID=A0A540W2M5_9ACTN|nr:hypothetical protein E6W39_14835 [Kitasatospora acidiphila]